MARIPPPQDTDADPKVRDALDEIRGSWPGDEHEAHAGPITGCSARS